MLRVITVVSANLSCCVTACRLLQLVYAKMLVLVSGTVFDYEENMIDPGALKKIAGRVVMAVGLGGGLYVAICGNHGWLAYCQTRSKLVRKEARIALMQQEISLLHHELSAWNISPLKQEALLRSDFGMGCTNEVVYVVK